MNLPREKRDRILLTAAVGLAAVLGLWFGLIRSQQASLKAHAKSIGEAEKKVTDGRRRVGLATQTEAELSQALQNLERIEHGMAPADKYFWLIQTVNQFRAPYAIEKLNFGREQIGEVKTLPNFPYKAATFSLQGVAHYHQLGKFVAEFENQFPYISLQNLNVERSQLELGATNIDDAEKLAFKMDVVALVQPGMTQ